MATELAHRAVDAARVAAYAEARYLGKSHDAAVKAQNKAAAAVRKALGFSIAKDDHAF